MRCLVRGGGLWKAAAFALLAGAPAIVRASAPEYLAAEQPAPASVEDEPLPMSEAYAEVELPAGKLPALEAQVEDAAPFWRDSRLYLRPRGYYFERQRDDAPDSVAAAYGGWLGFRSGAWRERVRIETALYTTQRAYGPDDKDGTGLLGEGQQGFWVLGEASAELRLTDTLSTKLYRQTFNLPYLNRNDSRMVPNTFEAYTLKKKPAHGWALLASHVRQMKTRTSDDFVSMSEAAGFRDRDEPLTVAAFSVEPGRLFNAGATWQYAWAFMQTWYGEANLLTYAGDDLALRFGIQYTDQRSVGDEIGGDFDTHVYGGKVAAGMGGAVLTAAFTSTGDVRIRNPYGGYPGYLSLMISSFNRAEEDAWLVGLSYDFGQIGLPGLSGFVNYAEGDTPDAGAAASPDQEEFDVTLDYRFTGPLLEGLWLRGRAAFLDRDDGVPGGGDVTDYRVILNYEFSFL
jgi:hypothetical protein